MVTVDNEHRRRLLAARQRLGSSGRTDRSIGDVANALALLHSTDPSTPYLTLHARTDAGIPDIDAALYDDRTLLRHTTVRRTVFVMPLDVVPFAHGAYNPGLVAKLRSNLVGWIDASPDVDAPATSFLDEVEQHVVASLSADGPATGTALAGRVPELQVRFDPTPAATWSKPMRITSKVLELLAAQGRIARGRPIGASFTSGAWTWEVIDDWLGAPGIEPVDPGLALAALMDRHLTTFGPATVTDLGWWSGLPKGRIRAALDELGAREVTLEDVTEPGFVCAHDDLDVGHRGRELDATVALLPGLDPAAMGWKQRAWYVDDRAATGIFDRNGNAGPTVWVGGRVVGAWTQRTDGEIVIELTDDVDAAARLALDDEAARIANWLGDVRVKWRYPTPLTKLLNSAGTPRAGDEAGATGDHRVVITSRV